MSRALRFYSSGRLSTTRALPHDDEITDAARALLCGLQPFSGIGNDRSIGSQRLQEHNHLGTVLGRCEPAIRLHVIAGHDLIGCRDEAIELLLVPYKVRALHGAGIAVVLKRTSFPSDDIVEVRTQAIVGFLRRVAGPACVVECQLPRLGVGALTRWLLGHGRETQKQQECGADQSRDCGAGHDVLLTIERASPHGGLAGAAWPILLDSMCRSRKRASALWMMRARSCGKLEWRVSLKLFCLKASWAGSWTAVAVALQR